MGTFRKMFKAMLHLSISTPQAVIHSSKVYNFTHLYDQQIQAKVSNIQKIINDPGLLGKTAQIRSNHLQMHEWLPYSPVHHWPFATPSSFKDWWSSILSTMKDMNLSFGTDRSAHNVIQGGLQPIIDLIDPNLYKKIASHLN